MLNKTTAFVAVMALMGCAPSPSPAPTNSPPVKPDAGAATAPDAKPAPGGDTAATDGSCVLTVEGMGSPYGWGKKVKQALEGHAGVTAVTMRFEDKQYDVTFDASKTNADALVATVKDAGFEAAAK